MLQGAPLFREVVHPELRSIEREACVSFLREQTSYLKLVEERQRLGYASDFVPYTLEMSIEEDISEDICILQLGGVSTVDVTEDQLKKWLDTLAGKNKRTVTVSDLDAEISRSLRIDVS